MSTSPLFVFSLVGKALKLDTAADLEPHIATLRSSNDVREIRLSGNTLGVDACRLLSHVLSTKKNLEKADLSDIFTGRLLNEIPEGLSYLLTSLLNLPQLHTINLNDNAFGLNTHAPIVAFLSSHIPLQHLYLNNNGLGPHAGIMVADALSKLHVEKGVARQKGHEAPYLETVVCGRNRLENGSMIAWARAFSLHNRIKVVKLVQNGIRPDGIQHLLTEGLSHARDLRVLDLQDNTLTFTGAKNLVDNLSSWIKLQELGLSDTFLTAKGSALLCQTLEQGSNGELETLRVQFTNITSNVLRQLAQAATNSLPKLRKVELNGNHFSVDDESLTSLCELLIERKKEQGGDNTPDGEWGLDSLSDLDSEASEDDEVRLEAEEDELSPEERTKILVKEEQEVQEEPVVQLNDKVVDQLAQQLENTET